MAAKLVQSDLTKSTLFVRNLPFDATNTELETFFGTVGPIKACFVVTDKPGESVAEERNNKGYGFVQYATPDDAVAAVERFKTEKFRGDRILKLEIAKHRHRKAADGEDQKTTETKPPQEAAVPETDADAAEKPEAPVVGRVMKPSAQLLKLLSRTVLISGLPRDLTKKQLYKKCRKYGQPNQIGFPLISNDIWAPIKTTTADDKADAENADTSGAFHLPGIAKIVYANAHDAQNAIKHLDQHIFKANKLHVRTLPAAIEVKAVARLVVRNLPFSYGPQQVWESFHKAGTLLEVTVPMKVTDDDKKSNRGFAFLTFEKREDAERALESMNGKKVGMNRTVAIDWVLPKDQYVELEKKADDAMDVDVAAKETEPEKIDNDDETESAMDDDLSVIENVEGDLSMDGSDIDMDDEGINSDAESDDGIDVESGDDIDDDDSENASDDAKVENADDEAKKKKKAVEPDVHKGTTLFIRNLAFEATEEDLREKFSEYGKVKFAKVTIDKDTGRCKGTGFVQYLDKADADRVLEEYQLAMAVTTSLTVAQTGSQLMPETQSGFWLHGRQLHILEAVDRTTAANMPKHIKTVAPEYSRNLHLLKEGFIRPDSEVGKNTPAAELAKRQASYNERKTQLDKHSHMFISKTRLSIRNLPKKTDEKALKALVFEAAKNWVTDTKATLAKGELGRSEREEWKKLMEETDGKFVDRPMVKHAKIVRDKTRIDPKWAKQAAEEGADMSKQAAGVSKGYGFVEFASHLHALACLRRLNNNPDIFEGRRLLLEFALENRIILQKRSHRVPVKAKSTDGEHPAMKRIKDKKKSKQDDANNADGSANKKRKADGDAAGEDGQQKRTKTAFGTTAKQPQQEKRAGFGTSKPQQEKRAGFGTSKPQQEKRAGFGTSKPQHEKPASFGNAKPQQEKRAGFGTSKPAASATAKKPQQEQQQQKKTKAPVQHKKRQDKEEVNFNAIVNKYMKKLSTASTPGQAAKSSTSRWFDV